MARHERSVGELLRAQLAAHDITALVCAKAVGASHSHVYEVISGTRKLSPLLALKLERFFGIDAADWLNRQTREQLHHLRLKNVKQLTAIKPRGTDADIQR